MNNCTVEYVGSGKLTRRGNLRAMPVIRTGRDGLFGNPPYFEDRLLPTGAVVRDYPSYPRRAHVFIVLNEEDAANARAGNL